MKLLVNGCSFSRGPGSWPYHLSSVKVVNLACAGAGNNYIHDTTIAELCRRSYDFVAIMWTGISRRDIKVQDIGPWQKSPYNSWYQSQQNDWPEKKVYPENDQDYVEKDWIFGCGWQNGDKIIRQSQVFDQWYMNTDLLIDVHRLLISMLSLQGFLKSKNIPYLFMIYKDYEKNLSLWPELYQSLDRKHLFFDQNLFSIAKANDWYDPDGLHPGIKAHQFWAKLIQKKINAINERAI